MSIPSHVCEVARYGMEWYGTVCMVGIWYRVFGTVYGIGYKV